MFHFCIFGGHEGQLVSEKKVYVTLFGGCELKQPTLAKRIIEGRRLRSAGMPSRNQSFFITLFGGTSIKLPTLSEEYMDLRDSIRAGLLTLEEWDAGIPEVANESTSFGSFTAFGGFEAAELPSEQEEVEGLAIQRHLGHIPESAGKTLEFGVGQGGSNRTAVIRQAAATQLPTSAVSV